MQLSLRTFRPLLVFLGFFVVCTVAAFHGGMRKKIGIDPWSEPTTLISISGDQFLAQQDPTADAYVYLNNALRADRREPVEKKHLMFWPPGTLLTALTLKNTVGLDNYPRKMIWVAVGLWSFALTVTFLLFAGTRPALTFTFLSALWLFPTLREFTFGFGCVLSESMGIAFFIAGSSFLVGALRDSRWQYYLAAGGFFGLAANFRMYFMMSLRIVLLVLVIAAIVWAFKTKSWKRIVGPALALSLFLGCLLPWSLYKRKHEKTMNWSTASPAYSYGRMWDPKAEEVSWAHAANAQCLADPVKCEWVVANKDTIRGVDLMKMAVKSTLLHPFGVAKVKLYNFSWLWWGHSWTQLWSSPIIFLEGLILLAMSLGGLVLLAKRTIQERTWPLILFSVAAGFFVLVNIGLFTFLHFEWRFSMPLRAAGFFLVLWVSRLAASRTPAA